MHEALLEIWDYVEAVFHGEGSRSVELRGDDGSGSKTKDLREAFADMARDVQVPNYGLILLWERYPVGHALFGENRLLVSLAFYPPSPLRLRVSISGVDRGDVLETEDRVRRILGSKDEPLPSLPPGPFPSASNPRPRGLPTRPPTAVAPAASGTVPAAPAASGTVPATPEPSEPWYKKTWVRVTAGSIVGGGIAIPLLVNYLTHVLGWNS